MLPWFFALGTTLLVLTLHLPAVLGDWYFLFWWYDVLLHTLGGVAVGFAGVGMWEWLVDAQKATSSRRAWARIIFVLGCVALIGIGWEWFEALADVYLVAEFGIAQAQMGLRDTMLDLYFDLTGGACAMIILGVLQYGKRFLRRG